MMSAPYAAGLFDGEGNVAISGTRRSGIGRTNHRIDHVRWTKRVAITNTHRGVLDMLVATYGGTITQQRKHSTPAHHQPVFVWNVYGAEAIAFLKAIRPYVVIKTERIDLWVEFMETMQRAGRRGLPEGVAERRLELYAALLDLNGRSAQSKGVSRLQ